VFVFTSCQAVWLFSVLIMKNQSQRISYSSYTYVHPS